MSAELRRGDAVITASGKTAVVESTSTGGYYLRYPSRVVRWVRATQVRPATTRAALETLADRTNPVCDACDQPICDPEPCDQHVNGHTVFFHPDCCPECQENDT